mmetsp:Transcript_22272/g.63331  ORF Transcript_22272/g.63331 Transcript_22272/m.63331 type:complete len:202 (-) Transcript_22272:892-1497(-)
MLGALTRGRALWRQPVRRYAELLESHPHTANALTGAALGLAGDLICQFLIERRNAETFSFRRLVSFTTFSAFYAGTFSVKVFAMYPNILPKYFMKTPLREGIASSLLDCVVHSPLLYLPTFYAWQGLFRGEALADCARAYQADFAAVMGSLLVVWIPVQTVNFSVVPRSQRVVFVNGANLVWNCILDFLSHPEIASRAPPH